MPATQTELATMAAFLATARREIGTHEIPGPAAARRIVEYLRTVRLPEKAQDEDETPWCSAFVNWTVEACGLEGTGSPLARSWVTWGQPGATPRPGAVLVFKRGRSWQGHVGFYAGPIQEDLLCLGGNQDDSVSVARFTRAQLVAIRYPVIQAAESSDCLIFPLTLAGKLVNWLRRR